MRKARTKQDMTLRELSLRAGIKASRLSDIERMRVVPTKKETSRLSEILKIPFLVEVNEEKAQKKREEEDTRFIGVVSAIGQIKAKHGKTNAQGTIECPLCNGKLHYTVAALNGHVWGKCQTEECLFWME